MESIIDMLIAQKAELRVTNAWIAEESRVPESTVTKVLNKTNKSPSLATIIPMAAALGVSMTPQIIGRVEEKIVEQVTEQMAEEVNKPTPSETIAQELSRQYERLLNEKDNRMNDKDKQIRQLWFVISILSALFLLCVVAFACISIHDRSILDREIVEMVSGSANTFIAL